MIFSPRPTLVIDLDARPALKVKPRRVPVQFRPSRDSRGGVPWCDLTLEPSPRAETATHYRFLGQKGFSRDEGP